MGRGGLPAQSSHFSFLLVDERENKTAHGPRRIVLMNGTRVRSVANFTKGFTRQWHKPEAKCKDDLQNSVLGTYTHTKDVRAKEFGSIDRAPNSFLGPEMRSRITRTLSLLMRLPCSARFFLKLL